ncbi:MAG: hypothetical protein U0610_25655 [bacterium]
MKPRALVALLVAMLGCGCGTLADAGNESRGDDQLPSAGVAPWDKVDLDGDSTNLVQPWVIEGASAADVLSEPTLVRQGSGVVLYYSRAGDARSQGIWRTEASTPEDLYHAGPGGRVLAATLDWERGRVDGASVVVPEAAAGSDRIRLWYQGGDGAGIGFAVSDDGVQWSKHGPPVLVPDQPWEQGRVASPCVTRVGDEWWLWYEGGDAAGIGFARSADGVSWRKADAAHPTGASAAEAVGPVLAPELAWEGGSTEGLAPGRVGAPGLWIHDELGQRRFGLYYSGFVPVAANPLTSRAASDATPGTRNRSIGFAASTDGLTFVRADPSINPVVAERTPLELGDVPFPPQLAAALPDVILGLLRAVLGVDDAGNPRIPALETVIDEGDAAVIADGPDRFVMVYTQANSFFVPLALELPPSPVTVPLGVLVRDARSGIALARSRR